MYLAEIRKKSSNGTMHTHYFLRRSYRENGKVKNETIANLNGSSTEVINAIRLALKHKDNLSVLAGNPEQFFESKKGKSLGGVFVLYHIAQRLGIVDGLGKSFYSKLALWLIIARILEQGSRLSAIRLSSNYDIASILKLERGFDENDLYETLHWLDKNQAEIEDFLFRRNKSTGKFYWYDVTSSYFEGEQNELAAFGYNRDKKKGHKQIVIGLLCLENGDPVSIEAFKGNNQDTQTLENQLIKIKNRFGGERVTITCDRGLIKDKQKALLKTYGFNYITALPLPQVNVLLNQQILKIEDFSSDIKSILCSDIRYIYRRNPERAKEALNQRNERLLAAKRFIERENEALSKQTRKSPTASERKAQEYIKKLCLFEWVKVNLYERTLELETDKKKLEEISAFDGCYVWTTDIPINDATDREIYDRYKDLKYVEEDFRALKTTFLEIRPIYVRTQESTRGHLLILMLAHMILKELRKAWAGMNLSVEEGLRSLSFICQNTMSFSKATQVNYIPTPNEQDEALLAALKLKMPKRIDEAQVSVVTRKKIRENAKK
jgi:transposase